MARFSPLRQLALSASGALALLLAACGRTPAEAVASNPAPVVSVLTVTPSETAGTVRLSGLVAYKRETPLSFDAPGTLSTINVDVGDAVRAGQNLASLRRATVGTNADEAALARETAERQLVRMQALYDQGFAAQAALDNARLAVERARDSSILRAPSGGIVLRRAVEPAQSVAAGQAVLIVGEPAYGMVVRASASSADAAHLSVGQRARIIIANAPPRSGLVARIAPKSEDATGAFEVEVRFDDAANLMSGQVAAVTLDAGGAQSAGEGVRAQIVIPTLALLDARADQGVVYVVDARNVAHRRTIQTGGLTEDAVIVLAGLNTGERIVGEGAAYVRDNEPVRPAATPQD